MASDTPKDHRQRDSNSFLLIGTFFLVFGFLVLLGTFWEHARPATGAASGPPASVETRAQASAEPALAESDHRRLVRQRVVNVGAGLLLFLLGVGMTGNGMRLRRPVRSASDPSP